MSHRSKYPINFPFSRDYYKLVVRLNFMFKPLAVKTRLPMIHSCHPNLLRCQRFMYSLVLLSLFHNLFNSHFLMLLGKFPVPFIRLARKSPSFSLFYVIPELVSLSVAELRVRSLSRNIRVSFGGQNAHQNYGSKSFTCFSHAKKNKRTKTSYKTQKCLLPYLSPLAQPKHQQSQN